MGNVADISEVYIFLKFSWWYFYFFPEGEGSTYLRNAGRISRIHTE
jgi:hypothetical protein